MSLAIEVLKILWGLVLWVPRRLRLVEQEKKEVEDRLLVILENERSLLERQLKEATGLAEVEALKEKLEVAKAAERACYAKIRDRLLERAGLPPYDALVTDGKRVLEPEDRATLAEAVTRLELLPTAPTAEEFMASATAKYALERYEEAVADYNRALELSPDYVDALINRGVIYDDLKRYDEAVADYNRVLELRPDYAEVLYNRGATYHHLKRYDEALADYNKALELRPDYPDALNNRGNTYHELNRYEDALADYNRALALRPDYPPALNNRGRTYQKLKRYGEALADYNRRLELEPDSPGTTYNMARIFSLMRKPDDAISYLEKAIGIYEEYREKAATDSDFDNIRDDPRFRRLV